MVSKIQILVTLNGGWGDLATDIGRKMRKRDVVEYLKTLGWKENDSNAAKNMIVLDGSQTNRTLFEKALSATEPTCFACGTNHGDPTRMAGFNNEIMLDPSNYQIMGRRGASWTSCSFGQSAKNRVTLYSDSFERSFTDTVWFNVVDQQNPENDSSCNRFFRCFHSFERAYCTNKTVRESGTIDVQTFVEEIKNAPPIDRYYLEIDAACLQHVVSTEDIWERQIGGEGPTPDKYAPSKWVGSYVVEKSAEPRKPSAIVGAFSKSKYVPNEAFTWSGSLVDVNTGSGISGRTVVSSAGESVVSGSNGSLIFHFNAPAEEGSYEVTLGFAGDP